MMSSVPNSPEEGSGIFPDSVLPLLKDSLQRHMIPLDVYDPVSEGVTELHPTFCERPLRPQDPNRAIGIFVLDWTPDPRSAEIGRTVTVEPTLSRYSYRIQSLSRFALEVDARRYAAMDAKVIRAILARDPDLRLALASLSDELLGVRERFQRFGISRQRYFNNELRGSFLTLCVTELWVETETITL